MSSNHNDNNNNDALGEQRENTDEEGNDEYRTLAIPTTPTTLAS